MSKQQEIMRPGKTAKDKRTGAWGNRFENRAARVAWQKDDNRDNKNFPLFACDGKKSRALRKPRALRKRG